MKTTTTQWLEFAKTDLLACERTLSDAMLTNIVAFHAQQTVEKCFKAIIEENGTSLPRIHDLTRLFSQIMEEVDFEVDLSFLQVLDSVYTTSRYPSDLGLLPDCKPTKELVTQLYHFAKNVYENTIKMID
jgi:HEPN domain-containing protein